MSFLVNCRPSLDWVFLTVRADLCKFASDWSLRRRLRPVQTRKEVAADWARSAKQDLQHAAACPMTVRPYAVSILPLWTE